MSGGYGNGIYLSNDGSVLLMNPVEGFGFGRGLQDLRGAQAMYKRGGAVTSLGGDVVGAQAKLSASNNKTADQILHKQCSTPMANQADVCA